MSQKQRLYFDEYYLGGKTVATIAREQGVNKSSVSRAIHRAVNRINQVFTDTVIIVNEV